MIDVAEIERRVDRAVTATVPVHKSIAGASPENIGQVTEMAKLMAVSRIAVPPYLRGNPGDCLAIILRAIRWQMDPYFVAEKSYVVRNAKSGHESVAFESQLIHAVIETLAPIKGRLRHEIIGEGDDRRCKVWATFKGETKPHEFTSEKLSKRIVDIGYKTIELKNREMKEVFKGSPLWLEKPEVQLFYDASRDWARLYCPDVLGGAYTKDELLDAEPVDITPKPLDGLAQRLRDAKKARAQGDRGFDAAQVERVGASIIAGEAQEATDDNTKRNNGEAGGDEWRVGTSDKRDDHHEDRSRGAGRRDQTSRQATTKARPTRAQEPAEEDEPGLPFEGKPKPAKPQPKKGGRTLMTRQRQPRTIDPAYLVWLRTQRCACGCRKGPPCDAAHIRSGSGAYDKRHVGLGEKPNNKWAVPLTRICHMQQHDHGNEMEWWVNVKRKDPFALAIKYHRAFKREQKK